MIRELLAEQTEATSPPPPNVAESSPPGGTARSSWRSIVRQVTADRVARAVFVAVAVMVGFGESILLPYDVTQRLSLANWQFFGPSDAAFTAAFALGVAWVVTLQVHATRSLLAHRAPRGATASVRSGPLGVLAALIGLLPSLLCCSPIVPTLVSVVGLSAGTQLHVSASIQHFFATNQNLLLGATLALVVASGLWSMRTLARARCLDDCCDIGDDAPKDASASA
jgi:hypothetical protein